MIFQIFISLTYLSVFVSMINREVVFLSIILALFASLFGLISIFESKKNIRFPKGFLGMVIFTIILHIYVYFLKDRINPFFYALLLTESIIYWLIFYNLINSYKILMAIFIRFFVIYSLIFLISHLLNLNVTLLADNVFSQEIPTRNYYFGVLSAGLVVLLSEPSLIKTKYMRLTLIASSIYFLIISNSRTSYLSLFFGYSYLIFNRSNSNSTKKKFLILAIAVSIIFVATSYNRTTIFDRPYFAQSLQALIRHPLGVGMGNFYYIAREARNEGVPITSTSIYTHNILLEALSGVGIFSLIFLLFLSHITKDIFQAKQKSRILGGLLIVFLTNFMLNTSYTVPGFFWLFFMTVGVFQAKNNSLTG